MEKSPLSFNSPRNKNPSSESKKTISFKNSTVFGKNFTKRVSNAECVVAKMLNANVLNMNGSLDNRDVEAFKALTKEHLWLYIYYLWFNNYQIIPLFNRMTTFVQTKKNKSMELRTPLDEGEARACANCFVKEIKAFLKQHDRLVIDNENGEQITREQLIDFLNFLFNENEDVIKVPLLENIYERITHIQEEFNKNIEKEIEDVQKDIDEAEIVKNEDDGTDVDDTDDNNVYISDPEKTVLLKSKKNPHQIPLAIKFEVKADNIKGGKRKGQ